MSTPESVAKQKAEMGARFAHDPQTCSLCGVKRPRQGGRDITFNNGLNRRWVCAMHGSGK